MRDLFDDMPQPRKPAARNADPDTSHAAARSMEGERQVSMHRRILAAMPWNVGLTQFDLARTTGLRPEQIHKRLSELARDNPEKNYIAEIRDTGDRRLGDTGRYCIVWMRK